MATVDKPGRKEEMNLEDPKNFVQYEVKENAEKSNSQSSSLLPSLPSSTSNLPSLETSSLSLPPLLPSLPSSTFNFASLFPSFPPFVRPSTE